MKDASDEELLSYVEAALTALMDGSSNTPAGSEPPRSQRSDRPSGAGVYSYVDDRALPKSLRRDTF